MAVGVQDGSPSSLWTPARLRLAGVVSAVGTAAFGIFVLGLSRFGAIEFDVGAGTTSGVAIAHALGYAFMLLGLCAAHAMYGSSMGRFGRATSVILGVALAVLLVSMVLFAFPGAPEDLVEGLAGSGFVFGHLLPSVYGVVVLQRVPRAGRPTAWLFVAVAPAVVLVLVLDAVGLGLPPGLFEVVLAAAFVALGHDVWRCAGG